MPDPVILLPQNLGFLEPTGERLVPLDIIESQLKAQWWLPVFFSITVELLYFYNKTQETGTSRNHGSPIKGPLKLPKHHGSMVPSGSFEGSCIGCPLWWHAWVSQTANGHFFKTGFTAWDFWATIFGNKNYSIPFPGTFTKQEFDFTLMNLFYT